MLAFFKKRHFKLWLQLVKISFFFKSMAWYYELNINDAQEPDMVGSNYRER